MSNEQGYSKLEKAYLNSSMGAMMMKTMSQVFKKINYQSRHFQMELSIKVSGIVKQDRNTAEDIKFGVMEVFMKDTGRTIKQMEGDDSFTPMEIFMTATGKMIRHMVMVSILILMVQSMKATG